MRNVESIRLCSTITGETCHGMVTVRAKCDAPLYLHDSVRLLVDIYQGSLFRTVDSRRSAVDLRLT